MTDATLTGSGHLNLAGNSREAVFVNSSSGRIDALDLACQGVRVTNSGSGPTYVNAANSLDVTITGSGDVIYTGEPVISYKITGSGNLRKY